MRFLVILAFASLAAAGGDYPAPAPSYPAPAPSYPAPAPTPSYPAPAPGYGGGDKGGYGDKYGNKKFYAPSIGARVSAKLQHIGHAIGGAVHSVGHFLKHKWLTLKSDLERIAYWSHCKNEKFKKYWKLKIEFEREKHREITRLEREKLEYFKKWCHQHKDEYERRQKECGGQNDYDYDKDPKPHRDYPAGYKA